MKLIATKSMRYATRRLQAGEPFEAVSAAHGRALIAMKRAELAPAEPDIEALRAEAEGLGIEVDGRWGEARIREKIEEKKAAPTAPQKSPARRDHRPDDKS